MAEGAHLMAPAATSGSRPTSPGGTPFSAPALAPPADVGDGFDSLFSTSDKGKAKNFKVVVRLRPPIERERNDKLCLTVKESQVATIKRPAEQGEVKAHRFAFDRIYEPSASQQELYTTAVQPVVLSVLEGYNGSIIAYGQTGTGKTFTIEGGQDELQGIIPRASQEIFNYIENKSDAHSKFLVRTSFLQIYNEKIADLLDPDVQKLRRHLKIREGGESGVYVDGLSEHVVKSPSEIGDLLRLGSTMRTTAATNMNRESSRSHAVFSVIVEHSVTDAKGETTVTIGKLNLVDLAGSERISKTGIQGGKQLDEMKNINASLTTFGKVILALTSPGNHHVPYRDSKLTRILQGSLGGNCKTTMITAVTPCSSSYSETLSSLKFAKRAKHVKNFAVINQDFNEQALLSAYEREIKKLRRELASQQGTTELQTLREQQQRLVSERSVIQSELVQRAEEAARAQEEKDRLERKLRAMERQLLTGGAKIEESVEFHAAVEEVASQLKEQYNEQFQELERERRELREEQERFIRERERFQREKTMLGGGGAGDEDEDGGDDVEREATAVSAAVWNQLNATTVSMTADDIGVPRGELAATKRPQPPATGSSQRGGWRKQGLSPSRAVAAGQSTGTWYSRESTSSTVSSSGSARNAMQISNTSASSAGPRPLRSHAHMPATHAEGDEEEHPRERLGSGSSSGSSSSAASLMLASTLKAGSWRPGAGGGGDGGAMDLNEPAPALATQILQRYNTGIDLTGRSSGSSGVGTDHAVSKFGHLRLEEDEKEEEESGESGESDAEADAPVDDIQTLNAYIQVLRDPSSGIPTHNRRVEHRFLRNVFTGADAASWFLENMEDVTSPYLAQEIGQKFMELGIFHSVQGGTSFEPLDTIIYQFTEYDSRRAAVRTTPASAQATNVQHTSPQRSQPQPQPQSQAQPQQQQQQQQQALPPRQLAPPSGSGGLITRLRSARKPSARTRAQPTTQTTASTGPSEVAPEPNLSSLLEPEESGATLLHSAAGQGDRAALKNFLQTFPVDVPDRVGRTPLMYASIANKVKTVEALLKAGASARVMDHNGRGALLWAAYYGHHEILKVLLKADHSLLEMVDPEGRTALHWSTKHPNLRCLEVLIKGTRKNILDHVDAEHATALHWSVLCQHEEHAVKLLRAGASVRVADAEGRTPLHYAVANDSQRLLKHLLDADAEAVNMQDTRGRAALHLAISSGSTLQLVQVLLSCAAVNVDLTDVRMTTPLHWAAVCDRADICDALLRHGAKPMFRDISGMTPLHYAMHKGHTACANVLQHYTTGSGAVGPSGRGHGIVHGHM